MGFSLYHSASSASVRSGNQQDTFFFLDFLPGSEERWVLSDTSSGGVGEGGGPSMSGGGVGEGGGPSMSGGGVGEGGGPSEETLGASSPSSWMLTMIGPEDASHGGPGSFCVEMSGSEDDDKVLRRLSSMGVGWSLDSKDEEDGDGVRDLLDGVLPSPHPPRAAVEVVGDLSRALSGTLAFRSRRGMGYFFVGEAGRGMVKARFLFVTLSFGMFV